MALGNILRTAREQQGLSHNQVADATHMMVQIVEELEHEDFHRFAAAIYGRGFVKLYAEFLGIDPAPLVSEFSELYEGKRRPRIATRVLQSVPEETSPSAHQSAVQPYPAAPQTPSAPVPRDVPLPPSPPPASVAAPVPDVLPPPEAPTEPPPSGNVSTSPVAPQTHPPSREGSNGQPDLFNTMASHAFGGEPVQPQPRTDTSNRRLGDDASPRHRSPSLSLDGPPRRHGIAEAWHERLDSLRRHWASLPRPNLNLPRGKAMMAAGAVVLLALLVTLAVLLPRRAGEPDEVLASQDVPRETLPPDRHVLPPPESYID